MLNKEREKLLSVSGLMCGYRFFSISRSVALIKERLEKASIAIILEQRKY